MNIQISRLLIQDAHVCRASIAWGAPTGNQFDTGQSHNVAFHNSTVWSLLGITTFLWPSVRNLLSEPRWLLLDCEYWSKLVLGVWSEIVDEYLHGTMLRPSVSVSQHCCISPGILDVDTVWSTHSYVVSICVFCRSLFVVATRPWEPSGWFFFSYTGR